MADIGIPLFALRRQVASAVDLIVQTARMTSGRRLVTGISEVDFDESTQNYRLTELFKLQESGEEAHVEWTRTRAATLEQLSFEGLTDQMDLTRPMLEA